MDTNAHECRAMSREGSCSSCTRSERGKVGWKSKALIRVHSCPFVVALRRSRQLFAAVGHAGAEEGVLQWLVTLDPAAFAGDGGHRALEDFYAEIGTVGERKISDGGAPRFEGAAGSLEG